tara:strand:- start:620 stop:1408 length:789 start_codon:yes stop_codon:yes gene_type:complete
MDLLVSIRKMNQNESTKRYYQKNKKMILQKFKDRRSKNKTICSCGQEYAEYRKAAHEKSKTHIFIMDELKKLDWNLKFQKKIDIKIKPNLKYINKKMTTINTPCKVHWNVSTECKVCCETERKNSEKLEAQYEYVRNWRKQEKMCSCGIMIKAGNFRHILTKKHLKALKLKMEEQVEEEQVEEVQVEEEQVENNKNITIGGIILLSTDNPLCNTLNCLGCKYIDYDYCKWCKCDIDNGNIPNIKNTDKFVPFGRLQKQILNN